MTQPIDIPSVGVVEFPDGMSGDEISAAIKRNYPHLSQPKATNSAVAVNAANKGIAGLPDMLLNTPNNLLNLGRAAVGAPIPGTGMEAGVLPTVLSKITGRPISTFLPDLTQNPDLARRGMEAVGAINPNIRPEGMWQKALDYGIQGAVGGALTGGAGLARSAVGAGMGAMSGLAAGGTQEATGNPALAATAGMLTPAAVAQVPKLASAAPAVMQAALKPSIKSLENGDAARAIQTMLDEGINVSSGGAQKLKDQINVLNANIVKQISASPAIIDKGAVYGPVRDALNRFTNQVNPTSDIATIRKAWEEFLNHPAFEPMKKQEAALVSAIEQKQASRNSALQDAGRFQTVAAQQQNLAKGEPIALRETRPASSPGERYPHPEIPGQTPNEPYMNVGATGGRAISPSAYPPSGPGTNVRFPERYTENIQRVPEAQSAYQDAMKIVRQRQFELDKAVSDYEKFKAAGGAGIPIQLAQQLKQGTYRILDKKYGQVSTADDEAQKAIARGLKEQIAKAEPDVHQANTKESALINALDLVDRRALMAGNKNLLGLAPIAPNSLHALSFMLDRSPLATSMLARGLYGLRDGGALSQISNQTSPVVTGGILADILRNQQTR